MLSEMLPKEFCGMKFSVVRGRKYQFVAAVKCHFG
jgi:hypothetical protein